MAQPLALMGRVISEITAALSGSKQAIKLIRVNNPVTIVAAELSVLIWSAAQSPLFIRNVRVSHCEAPMTLFLIKPAVFGLQITVKQGLEIEIEPACFMRSRMVQ